jgi:hypothetical protein
MYFIKAEVRLEGESNRFWKLTFEDGSEKEYYSLDESPRDESDGFVWETDPELSKLLEGLSHDYHVAAFNQLLEFTVDFKNGLETCVVTKNEFI